MADGTIIFQCTLDDSKLKQGLNDDAKQFESTGAKGSKAFAAMKAGAVAAGAAVVKIGTDSVKAYSDYEQLAGGVKKLFGDAAETVMQNAQKAYATAGMSANQYMEQATSFSASLLNSLGGDAEKAAAQADVAMRAISDNVNTFGTDMASVQNAFQGFAKQNYTMLDNLKLGYGGTKSEMQRLIDDANKWAEANGKAADLSIDSFSDVVTAIDYIQQKQNIAGTTAKEAATTIQGSFGMMQASWQNLLVAMSDPKADVGARVEEFTKSAGTFLENVLPIINNFAAAFGEVAVQIAPQLLTTISQLLPTLLTAVGNLVMSIAQALPTFCVSIVQAVAQIIPQLITAITEGLPQILTAITAALPQIITAITNAIPQIIQAIATALPQIVQAIANATPQIVNTIMAAIPQICSALIQSFPVLAAAILKSIPILLGAILQINATVTENILKFGAKIAEAVFNLAVKAVSKIKAGLGSLVSIATNWIKGLHDTAKAKLSAMASAAVGWAKAIPQKIKSGLGNLVSIGTAFIKSLHSTVSSKIRALASAAAGWAKQIPSRIKSGLGSLVSVGRNLIEGLWNGIKAKFDGVISRVQSMAAALPAAVKKVLGIASPSKVFELIGEYVVDGFEQGVKRNQYKTYKTIKGYAEAIVGIMHHIIGKGDFKSFGEQASAGFESGINSIANGIEETFKDIAKTNTNKELDILQRNIDDAQKKSEYYKKLNDYYKDLSRNIKKTATYERLANKVEKAKDKEDKDKYRKKLKKYYDNLKDFYYYEAKGAKKKSEQYKEFANEYKEQYKDLESSSKSMISDFASNLKDAASAAVSTAKETITEISNEYQTKYNELINKQQNLQGKLLGGLKLDSTVTKSNINEVKAQISEYGNYLNKYMKLLPQTLMDEIYEMDLGQGLEFTKMLNTLSGAELKEYIKAWNDYQHTAERVASKQYERKIAKVQSNFKRDIKAAMTELQTDLTDIGKQAINGFISGMASGDKELSAMAKQLCNKIISSFKSTLKIASPSKVFADEIGKYIPLGIAEGITSMSGVVDKATTSLFDISAMRAEVARRGGLNALPLGAYSASSPHIDNGTTVYQTINFNEPVSTPAETARMLRNQQMYGLAGARA